MNKGVSELEITILPFSGVMTENRDKRIDSPYFSRAALEADNKIAARSPQPISQVSTSVRSFGAYALTNLFEYVDEGIPFLRGTNYAGDFLSFDEVLRISPEAHALLHKSEVFPGTVLLSMSGSVGSVAVALDDWEYPINSNQDIAKIDPGGIDPFYLAGFLSSSFGRTQIDRLPVGSVQQHVFLWMIERLKVPRFDLKFEAAIGAMIKDAYEANDGVSRCFDRAEELLIESLQLGDWRPAAPLAYISPINEALAAARMDSQYFRPVFSELKESLESAHGAIRLGSLLSVNSRGRQPQYAESGLKVINSKHVRKNRVITQDNRAAHENGSPVTIQQGDVLLNGTGVGTIGRAAAYLLDAPALPDNHVTVLRSESIDPVYLAVYLNSVIGQLQVERHTRGSSGQIEIYPADISEILVWNAPKQLQGEIRDAVLLAFEQQKHASERLSLAKSCIEIAIDRGESSAGEFMRDRGEEAVWL